MNRQSSYFLSAAIVASLCLPAVCFAESATLNLNAPGGGSNNFEIELVLGGTTPSGDMSDASGTIEADFDFAVSGPDAVITGLRLTGGALSFTDITFPFGALLQVDGTSVGGEATTLAGTSAVVGGAFDAAEHALAINAGTFSISGALLPMPLSFDLSTLPFSGPGSGSGTVSLTEVSRVGLDVTYDVDLLLPIAFTDSVLDSTMGDPISLDVNVGGLLDATGRLTVSLPEPASGVLLFFVALGTAVKSSGFRKR